MNQTSLQKIEELKNSDEQEPNKIQKNINSVVENDKKTTNLIDRKKVAFLEIS